MLLAYSYMSRCVFLFFFFIVYASFPLLSNAATDNDSPDETENVFFSEVPNVISATRIRQPLTEAPSSVTVIDRDMIEASGAIELADVMRLVPGVQVSYPQGNQIAATYHGFSDNFPRKMQVLVDGRSVYQPSFSDVDWLFIGVSLEDIDRIEVVRGPNTPLYGSNAVLGVINIITRQPFQVTGTHVGFTGGSLETRKGIVRHADSSDAFNYRLTATYESADGLPGNLDSTNDGREIGGVSFRGVWQKSKRDEIDIQLGLNDGRLGAGAEVTADPLAHDKDVDANHQQINWRHTFDDGGDSNLLFYHNGYSSSDKYQDLISRAFDITPEDVEFLLEGLPDQSVEFGIYNYKGDRYELEWQYTSPRIGDWRSMFGVSARLNQVKSPVITNKEQWIKERSARFFSNIEYRPTTSLIAGLGLVFEESDQFGSYISPRTSLNYLISPEQSLRISYTRTKRNPSLFEDNFNIIFKLNDGTEFVEARRSNEPNAETVTSIEVGFVGYWLNRNLLLDVKAFREKTKNVMHTLRDPAIAQPFENIDLDVRVYDNDGELEVNGIEMQAMYRVGAKDFVTVQYANLEADSTLRRFVNSSALWDKPELSTPQHTVSALASHRFSHGYEASIAFYALSKMFWLSDGDEIDNYRRWDLRFAKHWDAGRHRLKAEFIAQNIGEDYETFRHENIFETRYFIKLSADF